MCEVNHIWYFNSIPFTIQAALAYLKRRSIQKQHNRPSFISVIVCRCVVDRKMTTPRPHTHMSVVVVVWYKHSSSSHFGLQSTLPLPTHLLQTAMLCFCPQCTTPWCIPSIAWCWYDDRWVVSGEAIDICDRCSVHRVRSLATHNDNLMSSHTGLNHTHCPTPSIYHALVNNIDATTW